MSYGSVARKPACHAGGRGMRDAVASARPSGCLLWHQAVDWVPVLTKDAVVPSSLLNTPDACFTSVLAQKLQLVPERVVSMDQ